MQTILTKSNTKIGKGEKYGWTTFGIHLAPYKSSGKNVCPNASKGCADACLNSAGYGKFDSVQEARIKKTKWYHDRKEEFLEKLYKEIAAKVKSASKKDNEKICFRLNLTSDIFWEKVKYKGKTMMEHFPDVQFYDYTKNLGRMMNFIQGNFPKNYYLTFSRSEDNDEKVNIVLGCGGNVAVVFDKKLPKTFRGRRVIDATEHDLRFKDPKGKKWGVVCGLVALGDAKTDDSGFVIKTRK